MNKERHPYIGNPYGFKLPEPNPIIHPVINEWDDFTESDKSILLEVKRKIISTIGEFKVSVFGSRIKGNWTDESDYDILINKKLSVKELGILKEIDHEVKVDILYYEHDSEHLFFSIEIP
jgi:predicted nucleotidyltransferase